MALIACNECGKSISDKAASCPHCGMPLSSTAPVQPPPLSPANARRGFDADVRAGIQQSKVSGLNILAFESLLIGLVVGVGMQSWGAGIFALIICMIVFILLARLGEQATMFLSVLLGVAWAGAAYFLFNAAVSDTTLFGIVTLAGLIGIGGHMAAFRHIRDIQASRG